MAVVFDDVGIVQSNLSYSYTAGTGSNRYLTVGIAIGSATISVSSMTYGGASMGLLKRQTGTGLSAEMWGLAAPLTGTNTVAITLSGANPGVASAAVAFTGVDQANPTDGNALGASGSTSPATSGAKQGTPVDMLVDVIGSSAASAPTGTQRWNDAAGDAGSTLPADGTSQTISWTVTGNWAEVVALLKATSGGIPKFKAIPFQAHGRNL